MFKILSTCKGGGYMYARTEPVHPKANSNGLYPLHRVLIEIHLNRILEKNEAVHHKDENKSNNAIENLEVITNSEHAKHHAKKVTCQSCLHRLDVTLWGCWLATGCRLGFAIRCRCDKHQGPPWA